MKTLALMVLILATAGCASLGPVAEAQEPGGSPVIDAAPDSTAPMLASPFPNQNMQPQIIIPVTDGVPVIGIPLGGDIFLPVTGGAPVVGIPTSP